MSKYWISLLISERKSQNSPTFNIFKNIKKRLKTNEKISIKNLNHSLFIWFWTWFWTFRWLSIILLHFINDWQNQFSTFSLLSIYANKYNKCRYVMRKWSIHNKIDNSKWNGESLSQRLFEIALMMCGKLVKILPCK